jgi:DNA repair photolyase
MLDKNNAVFHYTINNCPDLEPNVPALQKRIETLYRLCEIVGPERVLWRFDPICKYRTRDGSLAMNAETFYDILPHAKKAGVTRCIFSFMTMYAKLRKRNIVFEDFSPQERTAIATGLLSSATEAGMKLYNCCNPDVLMLVPGILQAHCIDDGLLRETDRFDIHPSLSLKPSRDGCGCYESRDIGSYLQRCGHRCSYCYASPA